LFIHTIYNSIPVYIYICNIVGLKYKIVLIKIFMYRNVHFFFHLGSRYNKTMLRVESKILITQYIYSYCLY